MIKRSGYIKRSPIRHKRKYRKGEETIGKLGRVRLRGKKLEQLRRECFERDGYRCTCGCNQSVTWEDGDMAHIVSRGAGGGDILSNVRTMTHPCHMLEHAKGKKKETGEDQ